MFWCVLFLFFIDSWLLQINLFNKFYALPSCWLGTTLFSNKLAIRLDIVVNMTRLIVSPNMCNTSGWWYAVENIFERKNKYTICYSFVEAFNSKRIYESWKVKKKTIWNAMHFPSSVSRFLFLSLISSPSTIYRFYSLTLPLRFVFFFWFEILILTNNWNARGRNAEIIKPIHKTCLIVISGKLEMERKVTSGRLRRVPIQYKYPQNGTHNISININQTKAHNIQNTAHIDRKDLPTTPNSSMFSFIVSPASFLSNVFGSAFLFCLLSLSLSVWGASHSFDTKNVRSN